MGHHPGHAASGLLAPGRTATAAVAVVTLTVGGIAGCGAVAGPGHHRASERSAAAAGAALRWEIDGASAVRAPAGTAALQIAGGIDEGWFLGGPGARRGVPVPSAGVLGLTPAGGTSRITSPADVTAASSLAGSGIPSTALAAYRLAARREATRLPSCGITWPLLAGIGRVESNHGRFAGATLHTDGVSTPRIIGIPLNGVGTTRIMDTDRGRTDGDPVFDRAVGPMQFIPSTWAGFGVDANHDGRKDPFNLYDAAAAAADYLCAAGRDLRTYAGQVQAVRSYNDSDSYIAMVLQLERVYAAGVGTIRVPVVPTSTDPRHVHPVHPVKLPPVDPGSPRGLPTPPKGGSTAASGSSSSPPGSTSAAPSSVPVPSSAPGSGSSASGSGSSEPGPGSSEPAATGDPSSPGGESTSSSPDPGPTSGPPSSDGGASSSADGGLTPNDSPPGTGNGSETVAGP